VTPHVTWAAGRVQTGRRAKPRESWARPNSPVLPALANRQPRSRPAHARLKMVRSEGGRHACGRSARATDRRALVGQGQGGQVQVADELARVRRGDARSRPRLRHSASLHHVDVLRGRALASAACSDRARPRGRPLLTRAPSAPQHLRRSLTAVSRDATPPPDACRFALAGAHRRACLAMYACDARAYARACLPQPQSSPTARITSAS